ncbi:carboxypeptidase-like regulatory domain-containing protein [Sphingobacterium sp. E70]|uniref:carboxypeptidase-like regulatory domain-containing protein n=1 Tax=Sphingobacterium sp. E70 TaxID=2853439 RepID=UPI00211C6ABA|nr:carboxypeptidase-like regulatory domain-containing protein [Sphingobacterium sp. E70]ULT28156.1 carboxypeptidase-like regulatory domain-containing protein [Sphingobacterium sp. E70]
MGVVLFLLANGAQATALRTGIPEIPAPNGALTEETNLTKLQRELSGRIVDQQGQPVSGVTVKVKGSSVTTSTDKDGRFHITVATNAILNISAVGYKAQELSAPGSGELQVRLESSVNDLEEVIVVGYGTQKKTNLTGAVASIGGERLENRSVPTITQALQER